MIIRNVAQADRWLRRGEDPKAAAHGHPQELEKQRSVIKVSGTKTLDHAVRMALHKSIDPKARRRMSRTVIFTAGAPILPPPYSQAVKAAGLVFVSGTAPIDPRTGKIILGSVQEQVAQCLANISAILAEAGNSLKQAISATLILADEEDFAGADEEWSKWFDADSPARQGAKIPVRIAGMKVSIAMIAEA